MNIVTRDIDGARCVFLLSDVPEDAPPAVREGLARLAVTAATGECPCGGTFTLPNRAARRRAAKAGRDLHVPVAHEADCAAALPGLPGARWRR